MRVSLIAGDNPDPEVVAALILQAEALVTRGDEVEVYSDRPNVFSGLPHHVPVTPWGQRSEDWSVADLIVCDPASPVLRDIREVKQAVIFLICATETPGPCVHHADVCLVRDPGVRTFLSRECGIPLERILCLPDPLDPTQRESYIAAFSRLVTLALSDRLPRAQRPEEPAVETGGARGISSKGLAAAILRERSDVMLRDYTVQSKIPVVGWLIALIRRTLTSHLREPYLDPTLERQVALNRDLVEVIAGIEASQIALRERLDEVERTLAQFIARSQYEETDHGNE